MSAMDIKAAARYLGVTEQTISYYVTIGLLGGTYGKGGKAGRVLDIAQADLDRLSEIGQESSPFGLPQATRRLYVTEIACKYTFSFQEAATISGLSIRMIREAVKNGQLFAVQFDEDWRLLPRDVRDWADSLFEAARQKQAKK